MRTHKLIVGAVLAAAVTALSACGGSSSGSVTAKETEFKLDPSNATVTLKNGEATIKVENDGKIVHALALEKAGPGGKDLNSSPVQPGKSTDLKAKLKPGTYEWYCPIDGHKQQGMVGKITVKG